MLYNIPVIRYNVEKNSHTHVVQSHTYSSNQLTDKRQSFPYTSTCIDNIYHPCKVLTVEICKMKSFLMLREVLRYK